VGDLEGRSRRLSRRTARLEEEAELERRVEQRAEERLLRTAISGLSTEELEAMREHLDGKDEAEGWAEEDKPLMLRLLGIKEEARRVQGEGDFPWRAAIRKREGGT
jgi:hypothetical protein